MENRQRILVENSSLFLVIHMIHGVEAAISVLDEQKCSLAGFTFAKAVVERERSELRVSQSALIFKELSRQKIDANNLSTIHTIVEGRDCFIEIETADLVDRAQS